MATFAWSVEYSVNIPTFDAQHQKLFALIEQLQNAMQRGQGRTVLSDLLSELIRYTKDHFTAEERAMTTYGYPELKAHQGEHNKLKRQVFEFERDFKAGNIMISVELSSFLQDWLTQHILRSDKQYSAFLSGKGVR